MTPENIISEWDIPVDDQVYNTGNAKVPRDERGDLTLETNDGWPDPRDYPHLGRRSAITPTDTDSISTFQIPRNVDTTQNGHLTGNDTRKPRETGKYDGSSYEQQEISLSPAQVNVLNNSNASVESVKNAFRLEGSGSNKNTNESENKDKNKNKNEKKDVWDELDLRRIVAALKSKKLSPSTRDSIIAAPISYCLEGTFNNQAKTSGLSGTDPGGPVTDGSDEDSKVGENSRVEPSIEPEFSTWAKERKAITTVSSISRTLLENLSNDPSKLPKQLPDKVKSILPSPTIVHIEENWDQFYGAYRRGNTISFKEESLALEKESVSVVLGEWVKWRERGSRGEWIKKKFEDCDFSEIAPWLPKGTIEDAKIQADRESNLSDDEEQLSNFGD